MSPWQTGRDVIDELLANRRIERRAGADTGVEP